MPTHPASSDSSTPVASTPAAKKPRIDAAPPSALLSRLDAFLPQMASANAELDAAIARGEIAQHSIEAVDAEGAVIEMNLGLGVLEEKRPADASDSDSNSDSSSDSDSDSGSDSEAGKAEAGEKAESEEVLANLLDIGKRHGKGPRGQISIQELEQRAATPTPAEHLTDDKPKGTAGGIDRHMGRDEARERQVMEEVAEHSKRHGKGPRGKAVVEEIEESSHTPSPEQQMRRSHVS